MNEEALTLVELHRQKMLQKPTDVDLSGTVYVVEPFGSTVFARVRPIPARSDGFMSLCRFTQPDDEFPSYQEVIDPQHSQIFLRIESTNLTPKNRS